LSSARAISVARYLMPQGVKPERLVAAGFGKYQPLDPATSDEALRNNRR
ncbi:MAG TPA: peptidoglycan-binding protein, partial [Rhizobiales bacterium]|nr:peptidoglycan-binding protein [Hyphomicrobiales bacterium]